VWRLLRRRRLPAASRPPLEPDERVVAWAAAVDSPAVVATNRGLWLPPPVGFVGWSAIHKATWSGGSLTVVPAQEVAAFEAYVQMRDLDPVTVALVDPDRLPDQVRTRVTRSVAYTRHFALAGGGGVRVVGRRVPGHDGLWWTVRYDPGTPPSPEEVAELVALARSAVGGPP
jgi:hypothetical protein